MSEVVTNYYKMLMKVQNGIITDTEWRDYCLDLLADLMYLFDRFERDLRGE